MKAYLLYQDRDFDSQSSLVWNAKALVQDLELALLFRAMAKEDEFIYQTVENVVLARTETDLDTILYRQDILKDCLEQSGIVRELYNLTVQAMELARKHYWGILDRYPEWVLRRSVEYMEEFLDVLKKLKKFTESYSRFFVSQGWKAFFARLEKELADDYITGIQNHLNRLRFPNGLLFSAELGKGNKACRFTLHHPPLSRGGTWFTQIIAGLRKHILGKNSVARRKGTPTFSFSLNPRDESGSRALAELRNRGIGIAAGTIAKSTMHVQSFLSALQTELAFYIGCMNLSDQLGKKGGRFCFPLPAPLAEKHLAFKGIYDICLALQSASTVVGNDADADDRDMIVVTGANQGGKSTLLRSIGLAQLMMQCGMFVSADTFCSNVCKGLFTHFKREEDTSMTSGKLDEELSRVSEIIYHATSSSMILFNESFAATNEREGSEIARQIISALLERSVKVICVTHLYELAQGFFETNTGNILFLRAQRNEEGERTFKLVEGQPLRTSFGEDLYEKIFYE